jgi:hypothetical protein
MVWNRFGNYLEGLKSKELPLYDNVSWDDWETRLRRYQQNEYYYTNMQYSDINRYAQRIRETGKLYVNVRGIYNPIYRMVNIYADKVYPGMLDLTRLNGGAIPVVADDAIRRALIRLFRWSNWNSEKQLYPRIGEKLGDVFINVIDDIESERVVLEVLMPEKVRYLKKDMAGNIKDIWIEYIEVPDDRPEIKAPLTGLGKTLPSPSRDRRRVTQVITPESITIYHDGDVYDAWDNPFGFVPVVHVKASDEGFKFGNVRWMTSKIDEINSQAALLNDQMRKSVIPYIATIGGKLEKGSLARSGETMDEVLNIGVPLGGDVKAIVPHVDIASALQNIQSQLDELREDHPELFLYELADMTVSPSGIALRQFFDLAVNKITGAQGVYDDALIRACQMAMTIGGVQGYQDFKAFNINSFDRGDLDFSFRERPVIYDALPQVDRVNFLLASGAPQKAIWNELKVSEDDQLEWEKLLDEQNDTAIQNQINAIGGQGGIVNGEQLETENANEQEQ